jgi:hypothetical protein
MKARYFQHLLGLALALLIAFFAGNTIAADKPAAKAPPPGNIADRWVLWPKAGHEMAFEAAVKEYVAWLKKAGDPFTWTGYQPVVGNDLTYYVFRSENHVWKDFDAEDAWREKAKDNENFMRILGPHVEKTTHYFEETDAEHSHMIGEPSDYKFFSVTTRNLKSGSRAEAMAAIDKIHKAFTEQKWPYPYRLAWMIGGNGGLRVVFPMKNWAGMNDPSPSVKDVLSKALGPDEAAATLKQFGSLLEYADQTIVVVRPDLSTQK